MFDFKLNDIWMLIFLGLVGKLVGKFLINDKNFIVYVI